LAEHGITVDSALTQFYQGVASGGKQRVFRYGSKFDVYFDLNTEKLGLWEGGSLEIHGVDWNFGQSSNADASFLALANTSMTYPRDEPSFGVTSFLYEQELGGGYAAMVGRYNLLDLWSAFFPDFGRGVEGFMNVSSFVPFSLVAPALPTISNVAGILKAGDRGIEAGFLVFESDSNPTTIGLKFPNGVTLNAIGRLYSDFGGLPGSHLFAATYSTGDYNDFDSGDWISFPPGSIPPDLADEQGTWSVAYVGEQRLWEDRCNAKRYTKLLAYVDIADDTGTPLGVTAGAAWEAFGYSAGRPDDRMGISYFYNALNSNLQEELSLFKPAEDVHGGEFYYNAEINPWFHLTFDLQAINTTFKSNDTAIVLGTRARLKF
jgi:porin